MFLKLRPRVLYITFPPCQFSAMDSEEPKAKKQGISPAEEHPAPLGTQLLVKRLSEKARVPKRGSALAAGYDIYR